MILNHTDTFLKAGHIPNFYLFVVKYAGTPDETLIQNIRRAFTMKHLVGKYCEVVFCLNQAYDVLEKEEEANKLPIDFEKQREQDIKIIAQHIEEKAQKENKSGDIKRNEVMNLGDATSDFETLLAKVDTPKYSDILQYLKDVKLFYTDWKSYDRPEAKKAGICGPDQIKEEIRKFTKKYNLEF